MGPLERRVKLKSRADEFQTRNLPAERTVIPLLIHDCLNKCGHCHFILRLHLSSFLLLALINSVQIKQKEKEGVCKFFKNILDDSNLAAVKASSDAIIYKAYNV